VSTKGISIIVLSSWSATRQTRLSGEHRIMEDHQIQRISGHLMIRLATSGFVATSEDFASFLKVLRRCRFFFHSFWFKSARSHHIFGSHRGRRCHFRLTDGVRSKSHGHCRRSLGFSVHHGRRALEPQDQTTGGLQSRNLAQGLCLVVLVGWLRGCLMFDIGDGFREFWGKSGRC